MDTADQTDDQPEANDPFELEGQRRLWLKCLTTLIAVRPAEFDQDARVQFALDRMQIAAAERIARICRSDLPPD
jgi:hypothetical protein